MKKLLSGLGTLLLVALPVLTVVSCSSKTPTITMKGSLNSWAVTTAEMETTIAAIKVYEENPKADSDKDTLIAALNTTSFSYLVKGDLPNFVITYTETPGKETITLTPNKGFEFSTKNSLISRIKPEDSLLLGSLNTGEVTSSDIITAITAIETYKRSSKADEDKDTLIAVLNLKSFSDLVAIELPNFLITYTQTPGSETITLTPNTGFKFGTNTSLVSTVNIVVIPGSLNVGGATTVDQKRTIAAIKDYEISSKNNNDKDTLIAALNTTSFSYLVKGDLLNFVITYTTTDGSETITLTPNTGFKFGTGTSLVSTIVAVIPGAINSGAVTTADQKTTIRAIKTYEISSKNNNDKDTLIAALNLKSFSYLVKGELPNFLITYTETPGNETITLTPNKGFKFSTNTSLVSTVNMIAIPGSLNTGEVTTAEMKTTIAAIKVYEESPKADEDKDTLIAALNTTSFLDLEKGDLLNFVITYTEISGSETITLTANSGFKFGTVTSLVSTVNMVVMPGAINLGGATTTEMKTTIAAIKDYEISSKNNNDKDTLIAALNTTSFSYLVKGDLLNFVITYTEISGNETITLTPNTGFKFGTVTSLVSTVNMVVMPGAINLGGVTTTEMKTTIAAIKVYEESSKNNNDKDTLIAALNTTSFLDLEKVIYLTLLLHIL